MVLFDLLAYFFTFTFYLDNSGGPVSAAIVFRPILAKLDSLFRVFVKVGYFITLKKKQKNIGFFFFNQILKYERK